MSEDAVFSRAAVAAPHSLAARAGRDILAEGGNAIEAMVAMAAAIAVVYPHANALGGDGFWLIREPKGFTRAIEACGFAGSEATIARYQQLGGIPERGANAALTVPGAVGGWTLALELAAALGGRLPLPALLQRATALAREGAPVPPCEARSEVKQRAALIAAPGFVATFWPQGEPPKAFDLRRQPRLADTFDQLAHAGLDDFYRGDVAREMAADLGRIGSPVTRADLADFRARWREPLALRLKDATLYNTPIPTQGIASLILIGLYERLGVARPEGFAHAHALIEAAKRAAAVRERVCFDPDLSTENFGRLLSPAFLEAEASRIDKKRAAPWPLPAEEGDTVWMGAIDSRGLAVSYIQSVYWEYGSGCVLERTGVLMQNRGIAFSLDPRSPRALAPGRRPFHTLNPPLAVFDDGRVLSYGSMGGDGQPQFQAQVFTRIAAGERVADAVAAPRHLWGRLWGEPSASLKIEADYDDATAAALSRAGHDVERLAAADGDKFGHAGALLRSPRGEIAAAHDPRADGGALGL
ncbi:MAG: gamma-glutamyltransferase family protein [Roseiarcus sp.]